MKKMLFAWVLLCAKIASYGQGSIAGKIKDHQQYLPMVNVMLLDLDSVQVKGTVTNHAGEFIIDNVTPGEYLISASMIGYARFVSPPVRIGEARIFVYNIVMLESATELGEVLIEGEKKLFDQKPDRLIINMKSSITSSGNSVLEVLQKSPGVVVNRQNSSIALNGRSGVRIMINNKIKEVPPDVLIQMMDGMNASNVEKIELITAPPAEYDAEGNAGIIHIITKENAEVGTNGSIGVTVGAKWAETIGGNMNINHRNKKNGIIIDYTVLRNHNLHILKMDRETIKNGFIEGTNDDSRRENITIQQNFSGGFECQLSSHTLLNLLITGYRRNWDLNAVSTNIRHITTDSTVNTEMVIHESNIWQSATGSIGLQSKISSKSNITFSLDYLYYKNENPSHYDVDMFYPPQNQSRVSQIDLEKTTPIHFVIAKADYQYDVSPSLSWLAGVKGVGSILDNDVLVQRRGNDGIWITDPAFTSFATLKEQLVSGYTSAKWEAGSQWRINGGVRYEYTHTAISTPVQRNVVNRKYGYFFPSLSISKKIDTEMELNFSYTKRITRPTYNDIAPFVFFWSPNAFSAGNTSLYPAIVDAISAGFRLKQWIFSLLLNHSEREITFLQPEEDSQSNSLIYRSQNLDYLNSISLTNSYVFYIATWWEVQSNVIVQNQTAKTAHLLNNVTSHQFGVNINIVSQFKLPKDFSAEVSGTYQSRSLSGISTYLPFGALNAGVQKNFGAKGIIRLSMDDIFNTNNWRIRSRSQENNLNSYFGYNWHNRFIRLSYTWNLGKHTLRSVKVRSGSEEERRRVN